MNDLSNLSNQLAGGSLQFLNTLLGQGLEAAKTGGVGAQIPIVQKSVEASRRAGSQAQTQARGDLARSGAGRTTQGQDILARLGLESSLATERIPTDFTQNFINALLGISTQATGQSVGAAGAAASGANTARAINIQAANPFLAAGAGLGANLGALGVTKGAGFLSDLLTRGGGIDTAGITQAGQSITDANLAAELAALGIGAA